MERASSVSIMPRRLSGTGLDEMRDDRRIDGRQHGLARAKADLRSSERDLLGALRDDAETQVVDAVQGFGGCLA